MWVGVGDILGIIRGWIGTVEAEIGVSGKSEVFALSYLIQLPESDIHLTANALFLELPVEPAALLAEEHQQSSFWITGWRGDTAEKVRHEIKAVIRHRVVAGHREQPSTQNDVVVDVEFEIPQLSVAVGRATPSKFRTQTSMRRDGLASAESAKLQV